MKKWIRLGIGLAVLLIIGLIAAFVFLNSIVKTGVEKVGPLVTKTEVRLASANLSPLSGKGELHGLFVGNPEGFKTPSAIKVGEIKVRLQLKTVTSDVVLVDSIEIDSPEITFEGRLTGSNLKKLLENISAVASADEGRGQGKPAEGGKRLKVASVLIRNAKVNVSLTGMAGKAVTISIPNIHLTNIGMDQNGVSTAELSQRVVKEILNGILKAIPKAIGKLGGGLKDLGADTTEGAASTVNGVKNLFKSKR